MAIRVQSGRDVDDSARVYYNIVAKCHITYVYNVDSFVGFIGIALYIVRMCLCVYNTVRVIMILLFTFLTVSSDCATTDELARVNRARGFPVRSYP